MIKKQFFFLLLVFALALSACSNIDGLSGKTFDVRVAGDPNNPGSSQTILTLEFTDDHSFKNKKGNEAGTYEWNGDKLAILIDDGNEKVELAFTLEENDEELNEYTAELTNEYYHMKDTEQISKYSAFYEKIRGAHTYVLITQNQE